MKKEKKQRIPMAKKAGIPLLVLTIFILFAIIPWESYFTKFTAFTDFNTWLSGLKIGSYAVFNNLIAAPVVTDATLGSSTGVIAALGSWTMTDVSIFLILLSLIIVIFSKIKVNDFIPAITNGIKKALPVAVTTIIISLVLIAFVTSGVNVTISNWILSFTKKFNVGSAALSSILGSITTADFYYYISTLAVPFTAKAGSNYAGVAALIMQSFYYLTMIIAPTSTALIIGLYTMNIPFGKWFKYIWKVLLALFILLIIASVIVFAQV